MGLAADIKVSSGLQLVSSLLRSNTSPGITYQGGLDELLAKASPLRRGDVVEVSGLASSGKTTLLLFLAMTALLPASQVMTIGRDTFEVQMGGKGKTVVLIDTSLRAAISINRLATLLSAHIRNQINAAEKPQGVPEASSEVVENLVESALQNLHVFEPTSSIQLAVTLQMLPSWFESLPSSTPELGYVLIDSFSTLHCSDSLTGHPFLKLIIAALNALRFSLSPLIFISHWILRDHRITHNSIDKLPFFDTHLVPPWPNITHPPPSDPDAFRIAYHITLHAPRADMLPRGFPMGKALAKRAEGRGEGMIGFTGVLREAGGRELGSWQFDILEEAVYG